MKHTKGPWEVCDDDTSVHSPSQDMIVHTAEMPGDPAMYPQSFEEEEANARLIAAAPELLEALKIAEGELRAISEVISTYGVEECLQTVAELKKIRAAIAKAEGRSE